MTPTDCTGKSTANAWAVLRYQPLCFSSWSRMASAWRSVSSRGAVRRRAALDDVGVEGALGQEADVLDAPGLVLEDVDEDVADQPPLFLGVGDAGQGPEEAVAGVH